jgi:signal-transduction protein with cAMP-binding, CBS, and nucleotidyltransferase domain
MDTRALEQLDSFPYRHVVREVMSAPPVTAQPDATLAQASRLMRDRSVSSVVVVGAAGAPLGILTEKDIIDAVAEGGAAALEESLSRRMSEPLATVPGDRHVYVALGRMERLGLRHLGVLDGGGNLAGVVTARGLLRHRAGRALPLGDAVEAAQSPQELAEAHRALPSLARALLAEGVDACGAAAVISGVVRDITGRAAALAERALVQAGEGPPPALYAFLVLGSAGRGESLLAADQDNAIVHGGGEELDGWFSSLGRRAADILNGAGISYCKGGVMASNPGWRAGLEEWRRRVRDWAENPKPGSLLSVDIFYDFQTASGDASLAEELRRAALAAARDPGFLPAMARAHEAIGSARGFFGGFRTENGRLDLKRGGLLPLTAGARVLALKHGIAETSTASRLRGAAEAGAIVESDAERLIEAHGLMTDLLLRQQLRDIAAGREPNSKVEVKWLSRPTRERLKGALSAVDLVGAVVEAALRP